MAKEKTKLIVLLGDIKNGFKAYGPFKDTQEIKEKLLDAFGSTPDSEPYVVFDLLAPATAWERAH